MSFFKPFPPQRQGRSLADLLALSDFFFTRTNFLPLITLSFFNLISVECEATPTDEPTEMIIEAEVEIHPVGHADRSPDVELMSILHEAQAREKSSKLIWMQEVWRNQRAAEACGGSDYSYVGRVREERLERNYKKDLAYRKMWTELVGGQ